MLDEIKKLGARDAAARLENGEPLGKLRQLKMSRDGNDRAAPRPGMSPAANAGGIRECQILLDRTKRGAGNPAKCDITQGSQIAHAQIPLDPGALLLACEFGQNGQSAEEQGKKHDFNLHANHRLQVGEHRMNHLKV
jgi:hypothetical protein